MPYKTSINQGFSKLQRIDKIEKQLESVSDWVTHTAPEQSKIKEEIEKKSKTQENLLKEVEILKKQNDILIKRLERVEKYIDIPGDF